MDRRNTMQPQELLIYLGIERYSQRGKCLLQSLCMVVKGQPPGMEVYELVAQAFGCSAAQMVAQCQRVLVRARKKCPQKWEELFPALDVKCIGLTLFLGHAAEWLRHNRIAVCQLGHEKYRMPAPKK